MTARCPDDVDASFGDQIDGCITCGDVAIPLAVISVGPGGARCRGEQDREEIVAVDLVGPVEPGDRLLVHAGVALLKLEGE